MFDIGWSEMAIIMLLALIIIGPKDLPRVARTIGQWVRKGRMLAREFQTSLEDMAKEAELDDVKKEIEKIGKTDLKKTVENAVDPKGELTKAFETSDDAAGEETVGKTLNGSGETKASSAGQAAATTPTIKAPEPAAASEAAAKPSTPAGKTAPQKPAAEKPAAKRKTSAAKPAAARKTTGAKSAGAKKPAAPRKRSAKTTPKASNVGKSSGAGETTAEDGAPMAAKST